MSGHNKWTQIKHKKEITDKKRSQVFSKLLRAVSLAAREDSNPQYNSKLKAAIDKAKENNVPQENIERAVKKSGDVGNIENLLIEAYGPESSAILIEASTDNKNRAVSEIKKIITDHQGKWADPGSVSWAFEKTPTGFQAKFPQKISADARKQLLSLMEALDDHDDVDEIYTTADISQ